MSKLSLSAHPWCGLLRLGHFWGFCRGLWSCSRRRLLACGLCCLLDLFSCTEIKSNAGSQMAIH